MRRTALVVVFLSFVLVPTLIGMGVDIGARLGVQSPSLAIQAEWDVSPSLAMGLLVETSLDLLFDPAAAQSLCHKPYPRMPAHHNRILPDRTDLFFHRSWARCPWDLVYLILA